MIQPTAFLTSTASTLTLAPVATGEVSAFDLSLAMLPDATRPSVQPLAAPGKALPSGAALAGGIGAPSLLLDFAAPATPAAFPAVGQAFNAEAARLATTAAHWEPQGDAAAIGDDALANVPDDGLARDLPEGTPENDAPAFDQATVSPVETPLPSPVLPLADARATAPAPVIPPSTATFEIRITEPAPPVPDLGPAAVQGRPVTADRPAFPETGRPAENSGPIRLPVARERPGDPPADPTSPRKRADTDTAGAFPTAQAQPPVPRAGDRVVPESDLAPSSAPVSLATPNPAAPSPVMPRSAAPPVVAERILAPLGRAVRAEAPAASPIADAAPIERGTLAAATPASIVVPPSPAERPLAADAPATTRTGGGTEPPARVADIATRIALPGSAPPRVVAGTTAPAFRLFAAAIHAARADESDRTALAATPVAQVEQPRPTLAVASADGAPLDMTDRRWPHAMMERIERLQEQASATRDAASTLIRLAPDALGTIDVGVRCDGDTVRVHFAAENAQTRALLAEAQPRLQELAEAKGLRLAQTNVGADINGGTDGQAQRQPAPQTPPRSTPASAVRDDEPTVEPTDRVA